VTVPLNVTESYVPVLVGTIDIPVATGAATVFSVFSSAASSIAKGDILILKNRTGQDLGVRINGIPVSPAVLYQIPNNGILYIANPAVTGGGTAAPDALASCEVETTVAQSGPGFVGEVDFYVFAAD
jgi:hypothetical protein